MARRNYHSAEGSAPPASDFGPQSLARLLEVLDPEPSAAAAKYESLRRKLIKFFEWRTDAFAEESADETINRIGRKVQEGEAIRNIWSYAYGVARLVLLETLRRSEQNRSALASLQLLGDDRGSESLAPWFACLDECLQKLDRDSCQLLVAYYRSGGQERIAGRKAIAQTLSLSVESLRMRAHRARLKLEPCVEECIGRAGESRVREGRLPTL